MAEISILIIVIINIKKARLTINLILVCIKCTAIKVFFAGKTLEMSWVVEFIAGLSLKSHLLGRLCRRSSFCNHGRISSFDVRCSKWLLLKQNTLYQLDNDRPVLIGNYMTFTAIDMRFVFSYSNVLVQYRYIANKTDQLCLNIIASFT